jgi:hypothetical protein
MLCLPSISLGFHAPNAAIMSKASLKSDVVMNTDFSPAASQGRIADQIAESEAPGRLKDAARCSALFSEGWLRVNDEVYGCATGGPPFNSADGLGWDTSTEAKNKDDMIDLATKLNPALGFWDPLNIVNENTSPETIGWFRHAEIKHGRVAMAGFIGYIVHSNGIVFPWNIQSANPLGVAGWTKDLPTISFADISAAGSPADMWDAVPTQGKIQIFLVVGFLEMWGETSVALEANGQKHYVRGGKPGYYPPLSGNFPHPVPLNLWDPFGFTKKMSPEKKEKALLAEINNGRLAMIGLFGLICASKGLIVPGLDSLPLAPYAGEIMAPFSAKDGILPFVEDMAKNIGTYGYSL